MSDGILIGMYSAKAAEKYGTKIWATPEGGEVEVTFVGINPESYQWDDKVERGSVIRYVRQGSPADPDYVRHSR